MHPRIRVEMNRESLLRHLQGQRTHAKAFLEALDLSIDDLRNVTEIDLDEAADSLERMIRQDARTTGRLLASTHPDLAALHGMRMPAAMVRRLETLGVNVLGLVAMGLLEMGMVTIVDGTLAGMTIECDATRRDEGHTVATPSFTTETVIWDGYDDDLTIMDCLMSQTACSAATGMAVDDILSSPLTSGMGLRVAGVEVDADARLTTIHLEGGDMVTLGAPGLASVLETA